MLYMMFFYTDIFASSAGFVVHVFGRSCTDAISIPHGAASIERALAGVNFVRGVLFGALPFGIVCVPGLHSTPDLSMNGKNDLCSN